MASVTPPTSQLSADAGTDPLAAHRPRIMYPLAAAGAVFFFPMAVVNFVNGNLILGALTLLVVAMLAINALAYYRKRSPPIPDAWMVPPGVAGYLTALLANGMYGAIWSFPIMLFLYFVMPRRLAVALSLLMWIASTAVVFVSVSPALAARLCLALLLTMVIINVTLNVIADLHRRTHAQAITDALTGAYNRRHMDACLREAMQRFQRNAAPATILLFDIDHFKDINDLHGHATGDAVLCQIVQLISGRARSLDRLFRMGGEEFLLLLPDTRLNDGLVVGEAVRRAVVSATWPEQTPVSVSVGVSEFAPGENCDDWLKRADMALYRAKQSGRNRVVG